MGRMIRDQIIEHLDSSKQNLAIDAFVFSVCLLVFTVGLLPLFLNPAFELQAQVEHSKARDAVLQSRDGGHTYEWKR